jgi:lipopolysaccharide export system protein LptA
MVSGGILLKMRSFKLSVSGCMRIQFPLIGIFCFFFFSLQNLTAQKDTAKVKLIAADILEYNKSLNPDYQILTGNVVFEYEDALLYCHQAKIYINRDLVVTNGNVHIIINDTTHMYGDSLRIDGDTEIAELMGDVRLIDNEITLTTDHLYYDFKNKVAYYLSGGEITDPENYLKSQRGYYYQNSKDIFFRDSVYVQNKDTEMFSDTLMYNSKTEITHFFGKTIIRQENSELHCEKGTYDTKNDIGKFSQNVKLFSGSRALYSDSLYYDKPAGFSEAFSRVFFRDTTENMLLNCHYGLFYEHDSTFFATDSALLRIVEKSDTLYLHADSLFLVNDTILHMQKVLLAFHKARMWRHDLQAVSDSIVMLQSDSLLYLYNNPILWMDNTQLIGDTIQLTNKDGKMDRLYLNHNAFIVSQEKSSDFQQIKSKNMEGIFVENELDRLWANEESETLYYVFDDEMLLIGINKTISEKVRINFIENKVDNIIFYNSPKGNLYPEEEITDDEKQLSGFRWEQSVRPKYPEDVFRNPDIEPEARERIKIEPDTIILSDSLFFNGNVLDVEDSTHIRTDLENVEKGRMKTIEPADTTHTEKKDRIAPITDEIKQPSDHENIQKAEVSKTCFLKRLKQKCKNRKNKKTVSLQTENY